MGEPPLYNVEIRNRRGFCERQSFARIGNRTSDSRVQGPVHYPLTYHFTSYVCNHERGHTCGGQGSLLSEDRVLQSKGCEFQPLRSIHPIL